MDGGSPERLYDRMEKGWNGGVFDRVRPILRKEWYAAKAKKKRPAVNDSRRLVPVVKKKTGTKTALSLRGRDAPAWGEAKTSKDHVEERDKAITRKKVKKGGKKEALNPNSRKRAPPKKLGGHREIPGNTAEMGYVRRGGGSGPKGENRNITSTREKGGVGGGVFGVGGGSVSKGGDQKLPHLFCCGGEKEPQAGNQ